MIGTVVITVEETSHSSTVPMKINNQVDGLFLSDLSDRILDQEGLGLFDRIWPEPAPVEVKTCKIASIVAESDSIDVDHRKYNDIVPP